MVEEIIMIDKLIKFDFLYNSEDATTSIVHCKSTGSWPLALLPLLNYSILGTVFLTFSPSSGTVKLLPTLPIQNIVILVLLENSCKKVLQGIIINRRNDYS